MKPLTIALTCLGLLGAMPASAQQPFQATYDRERQITLEGAVTRIDWVNPRAYFFIDIRDADGAVANWAVEVGNPLDLERDGWTRGALAIGDPVRIEGTPARGTRRQVFARAVVLVRTGARLFTRPARLAAPSAAPAPRWPDGRVRLGAPPGGKGYWGPASAAALVENTGTAIPADEAGLLINLADADRAAPLLPWAKAVYLYRQRTLLQDDPLARCLPPGGPRQFQRPNGFQFVEQRELGRVLVLLGGGNRNWRVIHTDGRQPGGPAAMVRSYYGHSVGRWEGDTLVVDSSGYNERFWFSNGGLPHTEALRLVERFSRRDFDTLEYEVTVDDPRTYSRPWTGGWTIPWVPDREIQEYFCEEHAEATFVR
jgi:hypothetical protein